ncbi:HU family DNA-binding protein [Nannocystis pusilla]|uniref:HU family DNA-binding protein n=1 Tax=Nannocystis pusilla TaxID=889268 RepID=UPI003B7BB0F0
MTRKELIETIRRQLDESGGPELSVGATGKVVDAVFAAVGESLRREGRYVHPNFGSFSVHVTQARPGRNPKTGRRSRSPAARRSGSSRRASSRRRWRAKQSRRAGSSGHVL